MAIESNSYNIFNEKYKDIDISSVENDSQTYDRKFLETVNKYEKKVEAEHDMAFREFDVANNNDDEMIRRIKINEINNDFNRHLERISKEYDNEMKEISEKYEKKTSYPYYHKRMFVGSSNKYPKLLNGLSYYIKEINENKIQVFYDVKFSTYLGEYEDNIVDWIQVI